MGPWANPSNTSSSSSSETGSAKALKAGTALTVDGGNITIDSADDSIHTNDTVTINGGYIVIDVAGDGVDSNGSITMTNGTVIVNGPENSGNGALDYDTTFDISGGVFVAAGNNGMVQAPSTSSSQASINVSLPSSSSNSMVSILDASGNTILSFTPSKTYQSVVISTPELVIGSNYSVYYGGSNSGSESDGLYTDGSASGGTELINFTLSSSVMTVSSSGATEGVSGGMKGGGRLQR